MYFVGGNIVIDDRELLLQELNKIKPARTLLSLRKEQRYHSGLYAGSVYIIGKQITIRQGYRLERSPTGGGAETRRPQAASRKHSANVHFARLQGEQPLTPMPPAGRKCLTAPIK